jgi:hypothetical protein
LPRSDVFDAFTWGSVGISQGSFYFDCSQTFFVFAFHSYRHSWHYTHGHFGPRFLLSGPDATCSPSVCSSGSRRAVLLSRVPPCLRFVSGSRLARFGVPARPAPLSVTSHLLPRGPCVSCFCVGSRRDLLPYRLSFVVPMSGHLINIVYFKRYFDKFPKLCLQIGVLTCLQPIAPGTRSSPLVAARRRIWPTKRSAT